MSGQWLEVRLRAPGELAEAVAELFARYAPQGVVLEPEADRGRGTIIVRAFLEASSAPISRKKIEEGLWHMGQIQPLPDAEFEWIEDQDWLQSWKANYRPIPVGGRLLIHPPWMQSEDPERMPIILDPGMAFGTGAHPSTRLTLMALEGVLQDGDRLIDVGCGSGILSIAAARLGAAHCLGVDIDPRAIENARHNVDLNQVSGRVELRVGSLADLLPPAQPEPITAEVVVANILAKVLLRLLDEGLAQLLGPGGTLILSGILDSQMPAMRMACRAAGLQEWRELAEGEWRALVLKKTPPSAERTGSGASSR